LIIQKKIVSPEAETRTVLGFRKETAMDVRLTMSFGLEIKGSELKPGDLAKVLLQPIPLLDTHPFTAEEILAAAQKVLGWAKPPPKYLLRQVVQADWFRKQGERWFATFQFCYHASKEMDALFAKMNR